MRGGDTTKKVGEDKLVYLHYAAPLDTSFDCTPDKHWGSAQDTRDADFLSL